MDRRPPRPMTLFDDMVTPPYLYTLKLMLPYTPSSNQRFLAMYIKFIELRYTMEHFHGFPAGPGGPKDSNSFGMFADLMPYMAPEDKDRMEQMEMMMNMMEMMKGMQDMSDTGGNESAPGGFNPMDMMMGMMNPEQQEMFSMYSSMFDQDLENDIKNDTESNDKNSENEGNAIT